MSKISFEHKLPAVWTDGKSGGGKSARREKEEARRSDKRKSQKKEDEGARKGRKVVRHRVCLVICGSGEGK